MQPVNLDRYRKMEQDGLTLYVDQALEVDQNDISVTLSRLWWMKKLSLTIEPNAKRSL